LYSPVIMVPLWGYEAVNVEAQHSNPSSLACRSRMLEAGVPFRSRCSGSSSFRPSSIAPIGSLRLPTVSRGSNFSKSISQRR
jgi:hypothetical protein